MGIVHLLPSHAALKALLIKESHTREVVEEGEKGRRVSGKEDWTLEGTLVMDRTAGLAM